MLMFPQRQRHALYIPTCLLFVTPLLLLENYHMVYADSNICLSNADH